MSTKQLLLGSKKSWTKILQFVLHRLGETRREMEKRLRQLIGWSTRGPLTGECQVKWTCRLGGLGRAVVRYHFPRYDIDQSFSLCNDFDICRYHIVSKDTLVLIRCIRKKVFVIEQLKSEIRIAPTRLVCMMQERPGRNIS